MRNTNKKIISVIGGHNCNKEVAKLSYEIGRAVAKLEAVLVCGGLGGAMEAACQGAKSENGLTIGIITSYDKKDANEYCDIVIPSGLGFARNVLVVQSADVIVALPGEYGTLSEVAYALQFKKPVISLNSWDIPGVIKVKTIDEAVREVNRLI